MFGHPAPMIKFITYFMNIFKENKKCIMDKENKVNVTYEEAK